MIHLFFTRLKQSDFWAVAPPFAWLILFLLVPFLLVVKISFADLNFGIPPYTSLINVSENVVTFTVHLRSYALLFTDSLYVVTYLSSIKMAAITTVCCILIGYPMAYYIARTEGSLRHILLLAVILPFWTSLLLRVYANLVKLDMRLLDAAYDLGASPTRAFLAVTLPLSLPGVVAGSMLVFIPTVGEYVIPEMLGGADTLMMGRVMWSEFFTNADWPMASAITVIMVLILLVPLVILQINQKRNYLSQEQGQK